MEIFDGNDYMRCSAPSEKNVTTLKAPLNNAECGLYLAAALS